MFALKDNSIRIGVGNFAEFMPTLGKREKEVFVGTK